MITAADLSELPQLMAQLGFVVLVGSAINAVLTALWGLRWRYGISKAAGVRLSYAKALTAIVASFPVGNLLPANKLAQEAFRMAYVEAPSDARAKVMSATVLEWVSEAAIVGALLIAVIARHYVRELLAAAALAAATSSQEGTILERGRKAARDFVGGVRALASNKDVVAMYLAVSSAIIVLDMFKVYEILYLLGVRLALLDLITLYVVLRVSSLGPTPAGLGFLEAGAAAALGLMGVPAAAIAEFIVAIRLVDTVVPSLAGLVVLSLTGGLRVLRAVRGRAYGEPKD